MGGDAQPAVTTAAALRHENTAIASLSSPALSHFTIHQATLFAPCVAET
jgi:hypothetical protein